MADNPSNPWRQLSYSGGEQPCVRDGCPKGRDTPSAAWSRNRREPGARQRATPYLLVWHHMLAFDGETLNEPIAEVSRQTGWQFELEDPGPGDMRVGGNVAADPGSLHRTIVLEPRSRGAPRWRPARRPVSSRMRPDVFDFTRKLVVQGHGYLARKDLRGDR